MEDRLYKKLEAYGKSDFYPFHMPGHKRNPLTVDGDFPVERDITEINGFDNLHHAEDILKRAQENVARIYGVQESFFSINGSSGAILAAVSAAVKKGGHILVARNCHKAVYHGIYLRDLEATYIYPHEDSRLGINGGISPSRVEMYLAENPDIEAVLITSPTYDGIVSDVARIAEAAHNHGVPLIVDEAHGAHFIYHEAFPESAANSGADIVIQSLHKTLPAFTQTGLLHLCTDCVTREMMQKKLSIFQSSSPSYVLIASIEQCIHICNENRGYFQQYYEKLWILREKLEELKYIKLVPTDDIGKLVFSVKDTTISGEELFEILRDNYHLEMEMSELYYVIAMTSVCDTQEGYDRLYQALKEIDSEITKKNTEYLFLENDFHQNKKMLKPEEAATKDRIQIDYDDAKDEIAAEFIFLYPPGIPLVVPGEVIDKYVIDKIRQYEQYNMKVIGLDDHKIYIINR